MRGISFPSLKYSQKTDSLDLFEGSLRKAIEYFSEKLKKTEDIYTGLIIGPEDSWQFSLIIYVATLMLKSTPADIERLLEKFWKKRKK